LADVVRLVVRVDFVVVRLAAVDLAVAAPLGDFDAAGFAALGFAAAGFEADRLTVVALFDTELLDAALLDRVAFFGELPFGMALATALPALVAASPTALPAITAAPPTALPGPDAATVPAALLTVPAALPAVLPTFFPTSFRSLPVSGIPYPPRAASSGGRP
jgi:hypothetical protein